VTQAGQGKLQGESNQEGCGVQDLIVKDGELWL